MKTLSSVSDTDIQRPRWTYKANEQRVRSNLINNSYLEELKEQPVDLESQSQPTDRAADLLKLSNSANQVNYQIGFAKTIVGNSNFKMAGYSLMSLDSVFNIFCFAVEKTRSTLRNIYNGIRASSVRGTLYQQSDIENQVPLEGSGLFSYFRRGS